MSDSPTVSTTPAATTTGRPVVRVRFFAAARTAAGTPETSVEITPRTTVADVLAAAVEQCGPGLPTVLARCSLLLDQVAVHGHDTRVGPDSTLDVLPPFAGG